MASYSTKKSSWKEILNLENTQFHFIEYISVISSLVGILLILAFSKIIYKDSKIVLPINFPHLTVILKWLFILIGFSLFINFCVDKLGVDMNENAFVNNVLLYSSSIPLLFYGIGISQPIFEEFLFRGLLFKGLENKIGGINTVLVTSLLFVLPHIQYDFSILSLILLPNALILGFCRLKTKGLTVPIILHCINNTVTLLIAI